MDVRQIRSAKTNSVQWAVLVDFLLKYPEMVTKTFVGLDAREHYKSLWEEIALQLNSMGYGSKTADKWIEAFTKWKSKVKVKAQSISLGMKGGGPLPQLSPIEDKLMGIIGWTAVEGDATLELGLNNTVTVECSLDEPAASEDVHVMDTDPIPTMIVPPPLVPITQPSTSNLPKVPIVATGAKPTNLVKITRPKKVIRRNSRKGDEMTLLRMHQETISILKDINHNLSRVADCTEAFLKLKAGCTEG